MSAYVKLAGHWLDDMVQDLDAIEAIATAAQRWIETQPEEDQDTLALTLFQVIRERAENRTAEYGLREALREGTAAT